MNSWWPKGTKDEGEAIEISAGDSCCSFPHIEKSRFLQSATLTRGMHTKKARFAQAGKAPNTHRSAKETTYAHATTIPDVLAESPTQLKPTHMLARPPPTVTKDAPTTAKAAKPVTEPAAQNAEPTT